MLKAVSVKRFNKFKGNGKLIGFADIMFSLVDDGDAVLTLNGWKVFDGENGIFAAPPSEKVDIKNKETGEIETKWFDKVLFDKEDENAREVLKSINEVVAKAVKQSGNKKPSNTTKATRVEGSFDQNDDDYEW